MFMAKNENVRELAQSRFTKTQCIEAADLLSQRWKKNKLSPDIIKNKIVLNMGCQSGRYSYALKKMGAKKVIGIDSKRGKKLGKGIEYRQGSIFDMPFKDNYFDFVFCNGPLSHSKKWKQGFKEAYRVLKPNGWFWTSLYSKAKVWDHAEKICEKMDFKDAENFKEYLFLNDWPANKIFFLLDSFFSKDRVYFTSKQTRKELEKIGFEKVQFLKRGVATDLNEKIFKNPKLKKIYGEGDIRVMSQKTGKLN